MKKLNAELTAQVQDLARLIGRKLNYEHFDFLDDAKPLVQALVRDGYVRMSDVNLQVRLEAEVLKDFAETAIHRRREVSAMAGELQEIFDELVMWHTNQPNTPPPPDAANFSSATDR